MTTPGSAVAPGWRVWRAFETDRERVTGDLWKALAEACRGSDNRIDSAAFDYWCDLILWSRWGDA